MRKHNRTVDVGCDRESKTELPRRSCADKIARGHKSSVAQ